MIEIKTANQQNIMAEGGRLLAECRDLVVQAAEAGVTTLELDQLAEAEIRRRGAEPNFKGYGGYPYSICANVNDLVIHGFPNKRQLQNGDVFSLDIGLKYKGLHVDTTATKVIGGVDSAPENVQRFIATGQSALQLAIEQAVPGNRVGDISAAMQQTVESAGYSVVRDFVGHGVGSELHMEPMVPCFGKAGSGPTLEVGMTLAIEVMMNMGKPEIRTLKDGWQVVTKDRSLSAQFEHTVAITIDGPLILTTSPE
jgi:methionyl aminopeptidase